jgi:glutathione synthase/RimK-type ligase-like ATP-grasp enzyme
MWHFDDKLGQKYLLEAIDAPLAKSYVFYNKLQAIKFIKETSFPKVFKLRVGASSQNVRLIKSKFVALGLAQKAFAKGFNQYSPWINFKETIRKHKLGEQTWLDILKSAARLVYKTDFESFSHKEKGYLYLQEFIPGNKSDTRIVVVDNKAFGARRMVRKNDFRASGSHVADYSIEHIDNKTLKIAFEVANRLKLQCVAFDFVYHENEPYIVEISYGTSIMAYKLCPGYWDTDLNFHTAEFNFCEWIVDSVVEKINTRI